MRLAGLLSPGRVAPVAANESPSSRRDSVADAETNRSAALVFFSRELGGVPRLHQT
jgi:hypothetical protein